MKKTLNLFLSLFLVLLLITPSQAAVGWVKTKPASSESPSDISTLVGENNAAIDLMLSTYTNCKISYTSASAISVSAGGVMVSNSAGSIRLMLANTASTSVTFSDLDTEAEAASTTYYVYAIGSATTDTTFTCKISTSSTGPSTGTYYKRLGSFYNDADSNIQKVVDDGNPAVMLGDWVTKSDNTVYQVATGGFVCAFGGANIDLYGYTDGSNPPTTIRQHFQVHDAADSSTIMMPVKKGDYWKTVGANTAVYWIPLELN
jgi:hypothetical protein